jgi:tetratricopeptide (TPR) repeat protein
MTDRTVIGRAFPLRNPHFVGRAQLLVEIEAALYWGQSISVHTLHGTGGVGKTQLAVEYAYRRAEDYDLIVWVESENPDLIPAQLADAAGVLGVTADDDPHSDHDATRTAHAVVAALGRTKLAWLLIFDNAERPEDLVPWLPRTGTGHVLVTSRQADWRGLGSAVAVDVLTHDEAVRLLLDRSSLVDQAAAAEVVELLGALPLAVEQAGGYLSTTGVPVTDYIRLLKTRGEELIGHGPAPLGYEHTVATVWEVSRRDLHEAEPAAEQLLRLCAFLGPEPIPLQLFTAQAGALPQPLGAAAADELAVNATVGALVARSLARRDGHTLNIHRLLATAVRRTVAEADRHQAIATVRTVLRAHLPTKIEGSPEHWRPWRALLPHVLAATAHAAPHLGRRDRTAWLLSDAGRYLNAIGQPAAARPLLERALHIDETAHGPNHRTLGMRLGTLAMVLSDLGSPDAARPLLERALRITEATHTPGHPTIAIRLSNLAAVLTALGDAAAARPLLERALRITETAHGPDHPDVAIRLSDLAMVLRDLGSPAEARPLLERALRLNDTGDSPSLPAVAIRLSNLALVLDDLGAPDEARPLLERALRIRESLYDPGHPTIATTLSNLATVLHHLGSPAEARPLLERALGILDAAYGADHPSTRQTRSRLDALSTPASPPDAHHGAEPAPSPGRVRAEGVRTEGGRAAGAQGADGRRGGQRQQGGEGRRTGRSLAANRPAPRTRRT